MKATLYLACICLLACSSARAGSLAFQDSFRAFVEMRKLEEKVALVSARTDLEPEVLRVELQSLSSNLTQARIDFHSILSSEQSALTPWERKVLSRFESNKPQNEAKAADPEALTYLGKKYSDPSELSTFEWQAISEFFGMETQRAFLNTTFAAHFAPATNKEQKEKRFVAWINTPSFPILTKQEQARHKSERAAANHKLAKLGYQAEEINLSPFIRLEDQSEELQKLLKLRLAKGELVLLTHGAASAVLFRTFDLYPDLLALGGIQGWINLNGQLFGIDHELPGRKPASFKKISAADRQELDVRQEFLRLRLERLERQTPLGAKFPVMNVINMSAASRPATNLHEGMVPEGKTLFVRDGGGLSGIEAVLPAIAP